MTKSYNKGKLNGMWKRGHTEEARSKISEAKKGNKNPMWKGDKVGYESVHEWVRNRKVKPELCERCNKRPAFDLANVSGEYKRDINDYEYLCRKCHMVEDGRLKQLMKYSFTKKQLIN